MSDIHQQGFSFVGELVFHSWNVLIGSAVPLFVMLSGALLLQGYITPPYPFLRHRLGRVLIPFAIWSVCLFLLSVFKEHWNMNFALIPKFMELSLTTGVVGVYWYVYLIVGLYLITPIIKPYFQSSSKQNVTYVCSLLLVFLGISSYFGEVSWVKGFSSEYMVYFAYYILGYVLVSYLRNWKYFGNLAVAMLLLSFVAQVIIGMYHVRQNYPFQLLFNLSLFSCLLLPRLKYGKCSQLIVFTSKTSYGIYLSHVVIISGLCMVGFERKLPLFIEPVSMAVIVLMIELIMMAFIQKLKLSRWLC